VIVVFDSGVLIGLEKRKSTALRLLDACQRTGKTALVSAPCVAEFWRGRSDQRETILSYVELAPVTMAIGRAAGEALRSFRSVASARMTVDAIVMATASLRGARYVFTTDPDDLEKLGSHFAAVNVIGI
jgi:predicted nucleic acid-binding protein